MYKYCSSFYRVVHPALSGARAWLKYQRLAWSGNGAILGKMKATRSIFIHIPKTGGKSILNGLYNIELHEGYGHAPAVFYRSVFGKKLFAQYYKFAFVRNPWDRLYSGYNFARQGGFNFCQDNRLKSELKGLTFESFVKKWLSLKALEDFIIFRPQYKFICDEHEQLLVNKVFFFECIEEELNHLINYFDMEIVIPRLNSSQQRVSYLDVYDDEMRKKVAGFYSKDIALFGYEYDGLLEGRGALPCE